MPAILHGGFTRTKPAAGARIDWSHPLATGLVSPWFFNEGGGLLVSDGRNTGVLTLAPIWIPASRGGGSALKFSGSNYVAVTNPVGPPIGAQHYTIAAWIRAASYTSQGIVGWGNFGSNRESNAFRINSVGSALLNYWWSADLSVAAPGLTDGRFHHVVATSNNATRSIYMDGRLLGSDVPTGAHVVPSTANFRIGSTNNGEFYQDAIESVLIYNRWFSPEDVKYLYSEPYAMLRAPDVWRRYIVLGITPPEVHSGSFAITAIAQVACTGQKAANASIAVAAVAQIAEAGQKIGQSAVAVTATASLAFTGQKTANSSVAVSAVASLLAAGQKQAASSVAVTASAALAITGAKAGQASTGVAAFAVLAGTGTKTGLGSFAVVAIATSEFTGLATGTEEHAGTFAIAAVAALVFIGEKDVAASVDIVAIAALAFTGQKQAAGTFTVTAIVQLVVKGHRVLIGPFLGGALLEPVLVRGVALVEAPTTFGAAAVAEPVHGGAAVADTPVHHGILVLEDD